MQLVLLTMYTVVLNDRYLFLGETFVTRKITRAVAKISLGLQEEVSARWMMSLQDIRLSI